MTDQATVVAIDRWQPLRELRDQHVRRGSTSEIAYWTIRDAIRTNLIQPGERLIELDLAGALEMSRTPVRESLRRLASERLIEKAPSRGFVVPVIDLEDLIEIYELREVLEGLAARQAARRFGPSELAVLKEAVELSERGSASGDMPMLLQGSTRFHRMLRGPADARLAHQLALLLDAHHFLALHEFGAERITDAVAEHRAILEAIAHRDQDEAERLARLHSQHALRSQLRTRQLRDE